jgi:hypothetical protein
MKFFYNKHKTISCTYVNAREHMKFKDDFIKLQDNIF